MLYGLGSQTPFGFIDDLYTAQANGLKVCLMASLKRLSASLTIYILVPET